jgi:hypothetical protein
MNDSDLLPHQNLAHLLPPSWKSDVRAWYAEDTPSFDWAGFVVGEEEQEAILWGKSEVSWWVGGGSGGGDARCLVHVPQVGCMEYTVVYVGKRYGYGVKEWGGTFWEGQKSWEKGLSRS